MYLRFKRLDPKQTRWFASAGREFGLTQIAIHGFGLMFHWISGSRSQKKTTVGERGVW